MATPRTAFDIDAATGTAAGSASAADTASVEHDAHSARSVHDAHDARFLPTLLRRIRRAMGDDSVELTTLRICCAAMAVALLVYLGLQYVTYGSGYIGDWYGYLISIGLALSGIFMLASAIVGKLVWLRYSLYTNALVLLVATLAFPVAYYTMADLGPAVLRFTDFTGVLAISVVLLSPTRPAVLVAILIQVLPSALHSIVYGRTSIPELLAITGFAVLMNLIPFVLGAVTLIRVARTIDETEQKVQDSLAESESKHAAIAERKRLNGLVHDHILGSLSAIARGQNMQADAVRSLPSRPATGEDITLEQLLADVTRSVQDLTPDCSITVNGQDAHNGSSDLGFSTIKDSAAEAIRLSVTEAARNSRKHAGDSCQRRCVINITDGELVFEFSDDGRGFDLATRNPQRAGINVSILHRMRSIDGGDAQIVSSPDNGTTVTVRWCLRTAESQFNERVAAQANDLSEDQLTAAKLEHQLLQPAQVSRSWAWPYLILAVISIMSAVWVNSGEFLMAIPAAAVAIATLALLVLDSSPHIGGTKRFVFTVGFLMLGPLSMLQRVDYVAGRENLWALSIISLLCCILILRGQILWGAGCFVASAALMKACTLLTAGALASPPLADILVQVNLVMAATVVFLANNTLLKNLPRLRMEKRTAYAEAARVRQIQLVHRHWHERIELHAAPVFEAVQHFQTPPPLLRERARLTELAIRDMLRAPLLDRPEIKTAAWDARKAGATVLLLDDRSERDSSTVGRKSDGRDAGAALERLVPLVLERLNFAGTDKVTIRILPPGRKYFATITTDSTGITRVPFPEV
ncbi:ATP-binding protein [Corynebacterium pseudodiphtheriticum]|uniref:sensor histidine kinase n=1 Tax=Corynebacterium pseudodiphtheriticum TaxID=37637 RepID=UPI00254CDDAD|nr:ATP-binding protein [Corynebacterium pseudodiphtheriticum]MDK8487037.1 ATP-binding protein [Corynebacterium pseudodiphtheriticum]MDK8494339.1 ATP-binding protein [Corynebacterium pseudodiphtheriticum]